MRLESLILANIIKSEDYARRVVPYVKPEYFSDNQDRTVFNTITDYLTKYNKPPTFSSLLVELDSRRDIDEDQFTKSIEFVNTLEKTDPVDEKWLVDKTESFCQDRAIYIAISKAIKVADGQDKELSKGSIPKLLSDALAVSFDNSVGHDFLEDAETRYEQYHEQESRIPFDIDMLNKVTRGGLPKKTINVIMSGCVHPDTIVKVRYRVRQ